MTKLLVLDEKPFLRDGWSGARAEAAAAFWGWHNALREAALSDDSLDEEDFALEADRVEATLFTRLLDADRVRAAADALASFDLERSLLASQVRSAGRLTRPLDFYDAEDVRRFADSWAVPLARLLAGIAGADRTWQLPYIDALGRAFFLLGRLVDVPSDAKRSHCFFSADEMSFFGVSESDLREGPPSENVKKLLWKQSVRIRDLFAQALPLVRDLPRRQAAAFKIWWLGGLEVLNIVERRQFDVWSSPVLIGTLRRLQVRYQSRFSRLAFKVK